ncbi:MAG: B12-binding domain-containing protein [Zestosphaera sp.]
MSLKDLKEKLYRAVIEGDPEKALSYAQDLILSGLDVRQIVSEVLAPAMRTVGEMYEKGEYFIADLIASAEAFKQVFDKVLKPRLASGAVSRGVVAVFGTVRGDIHELGKNIAKALFEAEGFEVIDLGVDVPPEKFAEVIESREEIKVVGLSALMTTTMIEQEKVIEELKRRGLRSKVIVVVGGAPVTEDWVRKIGADVCGDDAFRALKKVKELLGVA